MSKISLAPDASGTGIFTIASPGTNTNRTLTLPDDTGTIVTNSGNQAGSFTTLNTSGAVVFNDAGADVDFRVEGDTNANLLFVDASTDRVGIGTSSPAARLDVVGPALSAATGLRLQDVTTDATNKLGLIKAAHYTNSEEPVTLILGSMSSTANSIRIGGSYSGENAATDIQFYTAANNTTVAGTERMRISSGGDVIFGASGSTALNANKVFIESNAVGSSGRVNVVGNNGATGALFLGARADTGANTILIRPDGDLENANNSYGAISDVKLKQDIVDAGSQWDDIKGLRVRKYRFKSDPDAPLQIGLIAQEVEGVSAGLVKEVADHVRIEVPVLDDDGNPFLDEEGNPQVRIEEQETGETTKSIKYSVLYMKAVKALQEAMERIETLEASNTALEARIAALETGA